MDEIRLEGPTPARDRAAVSLRIDAETKKKIEIIAESAHVSQQKVMTQFLKFGLAQWERQEQEAARAVVKRRRPNRKRVPG